MRQNVPKATVDTLGVKRKGQMRNHQNHQKTEGYLSTHNVQLLADANATDTYVLWVTFTLEEMDLHQ